MRLLHDRHIIILWSVARENDIRANFIFVIDEKTTSGFKAYIKSV